MIAGYYDTCDDALCVDCYDPDDWDGFEDWAEPLMIFEDAESDTPTNCTKCEALIPHALTPDGYAYVREAAGDMSRPHRDMRDRNFVVRAWVAEYYPGV